MEKHDLNDPIPAGEGKSITQVTVGKPRLIHIQQLVLAIGPDTIVALIERDRTGDDDGLSKAEVARLLSSLVSKDRFEAFNEALGNYLGISAADAGMLSLDDLFEIGRKTAGFFTDIATVAEGMLSEET